ncbi:MAG: histidinol-phosphate transaminase [Candidatus Pacebacteria bacterium]|nr:histidinol-phosphate transaminase [Candidatus Paceibacterota bacterium]
MEIIPLDLNESYWLLDDDTLALLRNMPRSAFSTYPSYDELTANIATYAGVPQESVCLTPGSDEAIRATVRYCAKRRYRTLLILPTFSGYEKVLMETPLETVRLYYREQDGTFVFPLEETLQCIRNKEVDVVFLCEPNNPLGSTLGDSAFSQILSAAREVGVLVVSDEAYGEYGGSSALQAVAQQPVIVLRTLSKAFGVPGIRVGYAITSREIAEELRSDLFGTLPWIIPGPSVYAANIVLSRVSELQQRKALIIEQRAVFATALARFPHLLVYPSSCNFILTRHSRANEICESLASAGIRVSAGERKTWDDTAKELLRETLRFAIPAPEHMAAVVGAIEQVLDKEAVSVL